MKYVENNLRKDESIVMAAKVTMLAIIPRIILALALCIIPVVGWILAPIIIIIKFFELKSIELAVTTKRVMGHYGLVPEKVMDAPLNKVNTVSVEKGLLASIFGYGTVAVTTSSGSYNLKYIQQPDQIKAAIIEQMDVFEEDRIKMQAEQLAKAIK